MKTGRIFVDLIVIGAVTLSSALAAIPSPTPAWTTKSGVIEKDEIWYGTIIMTGDVLIPEERTVTILAHTQIIFNNSDISPMGHLPDQPELIVLGALKTPREGAVAVISIDDPAAQGFLANVTGTQEIQVTPQPVSAESLRKEWEAYKFQYAILWALAYGLFYIR